MRYTTLGRGDVGRRDPLDCDDYEPEEEELECWVCGCHLDVLDADVSSYGNGYAHDDCIEEDEARKSRDSIRRTARRYGRA